MRIKGPGLSALAAILLFPFGSDAQSPDVKFAHGADYTFERMQAVRTTDDEGQITLIAYVYRPVKTVGREVVIFNHGSTGGWATSPKEPVALTRSYIEYFIRRGFILVIPLRRGFGESSGSYREECAYQAGKCTLAESRAVAERALPEASKDLDAVIDQLVIGKLAPPEAKILMVGQSRGGFLSLYYAANRPEMVKGVISFVGGQASISNKWPPEENAARMKLHEKVASSAGAALKVPTLWIYGARDSFYEEGASSQWFKAFKDAGGKGEIRLHQ